MKTAARNAIDAMRRVDPEARFLVRFWDGDEIAVGDGAPQFTLWMKTREAVQRTFGDGFLGFGECYMAGDIEIEGDGQLLFKLGHLIDFGNMSLSLKEKLRFAAAFLLSQNTRRNAPKNVTFHYNLGNDFFELFLDPTMTYTCAYFRTPDDTLEQAQLNKYEHVCRKLVLREGDHLADLGCGWGGMLIYAAQNYGITGVGVSLSQPQVEYANRRIAELGLQDRIEVRLSDYRDLEGSFDKVASIGMLEHVGKGFIGTCVQKIHDLLKPGGVALLHSISNDTPFPDDPWTMKYLFPGTHVPVLSHVIEEISTRRLSVLDVENLRQHYGRTIDFWAESYDRNYDKVRDKFGDSFARCYRLYWLVTSTSFKYGGNRLFQTVFSKGLNNDLPWTRAHIYR